MPLQEVQDSGSAGRYASPRVVKYSFNKVYNDPKLWDLWREPVTKSGRSFTKRVELNGDYQHRGTR